MIDLENTNQGYLCGRLFAVLEYAQQQANGSATIGERYIGAASATPASVFPTLMKLSVHHLEKVSKTKPGTKRYAEGYKEEIMSKLPSSGFPSHLSINDQGRFMVGYYHQREDLWTSKSEKENK